MGQGTYGCVAAFRDNRLGRDVAVKRIPDPFRDPLHNGKRCLRELKLLRRLKHDTIVSDKFHSATQRFIYIIETKKMSIHAPSPFCAAATKRS